VGSQVEPLINYRKAFLQQKAQEDVRSIALYIAEDNPEAARQFRIAIENARETIGALPEIGSAYNFDNTELKGLRMLLLRKFKKYLIFYRFNKIEDITEIVRVVHSARDLPTLFGTSVKEKEDGEERKAA
jgi:toxin ParE1/3/4